MPGDHSGWVLQEEADEERQRRRRELLVALEQKDLAQIHKRTLYILQHYPETRDDDRALVVRYWRAHQADLLEGNDRIEAVYELDRFTTISRMRRLIQQLGLFRGSRSRATIEGAQLEFFEYLRSQKEGQPEIRFFLDETGNDPRERYAGVAGVCVLDWRTYQKHHGGLTNWRARQGWPETLHFADVEKDEQLRQHLALLAQLGRRRPGLLFVGHSIRCTAAKGEVFAHLFEQLVLDSLAEAARMGCLDGERDVLIVKEAEEFFDKRYLQLMRDGLAKGLRDAYRGRIALRDVIPVPKGREVMLECADLLAGAMQRRHRRQGRHPKDRLAEAVMNLTELGSSGAAPEDAARYRLFPPQPVS